MTDCFIATDRVLASDVTAPYATVMEFIGYVLVKEYSKWHRLDKRLIDEAKRFWVPKEMLKKLQGEKHEEGADR